MGLLDDAIREHLDLKRKHGATDDDLRRQETEALGPARRDFAPDASQAAEPAEAELADAAPAPADPAADEAGGWLDEPGTAPFDAAAEAQPVQPARAPAPVEPAPETSESTLPQEPPPAAEPAPPPAPARRESQTPTEGFPALKRDDEPESEEDEDVLEETPDFLQDTPEHDRLWFEQKPPRDFDFDG